MNVILLKDIRNIGKKFDIKTVSDGYALNFLIPNKLAELAETGSVKKVELMKVHSDLKKKTEMEALRKSLSKIDGQTVTMEAKVNEKGHLFKGIHQAEIVKLIKEKTGVDMDPQSVTLEKPIKEIGAHTIPLSVGDSTVNFTLEVTAKV